MILIADKQQGGVKSGEQSKGWRYKKNVSKNTGSTIIDCGFVAPCGLLTFSSEKEPSSNPLITDTYDMALNTTVKPFDSLIDLYHAHLLQLFRL